MREFAFLLLTVAVIAGAASETPRKKHAQARNRAAESHVLDSSAVESTAWHGGKPAAILRSQILLARAHFSPGEIDGLQGDNYHRALGGFQRARNVGTDGRLDQATWTALNSDTAPVLITYTITAEDAAGPFVEIPADMMEQAKLAALGYGSLEEKLAEQFHISTRLLKRLNPDAKLATGTQIRVPDTGAPAQTRAAKIVITKAGILTAFDANGKTIAQYPCSSGSEHDPLPIGTWKVEKVVKDPPFFYNPALFWDASPEHTKAKIAAGPNNPVGVVWIDLTKEHYGIHGTPLPASVGHEQSHGCIRLTNWDALELAGLVHKGTPVICQE